jgi:DHA1 family bicyclomycin/chloramphenicol resistance-like MFS transporter
MTAPVAPATPVLKNKVLTILILGILTTISPFTIDMYLPAFQQIADDLSTTTGQVSLSLSSYFAGMAIGQIIYGPLLDRFGRKKPLYAGLTLYVICSLGCLLSQNVETLIGLRFILALGGCVAQVATMAMVRDFFPPKDSAKIFSLLVLILSVSPLLAPTAGGFVTTYLGWHAIFIFLAVIVALIMVLAHFFLPSVYKGDPTVSLKPAPVIANFAAVIKVPQFYTYVFSSAFAFTTLFIYVTASPIIFLDIFKVTPDVYGAIFAFIAVGIIGSNQVNVWLTRYYSSEQIFKSAMIALAVISTVFLIGSYLGWFGLWPTIFFFFAMLSCLGMTNPNANALALTPFTSHIGSASALIGFLQIALATIASSFVSILGGEHVYPLLGIIVVAVYTGLIILWLGKRQIVRAAASEA